MKQYEDMNREDKINMYKGMDTAKAYIEKQASTDLATVETLQQELAEDIQGKQLEIEFPEEDFTLWIGA